MKLLEYEAKNILRSASIPIPDSHVISSVSDEAKIPVVLKSQVPTGGRGKAGGIRLIEDASLLKTAMGELFFLKIKGFTPKVLLAEEKIEIEHEYYLSVLINKPAAKIQLMAHKNGGVEVEANDPGGFLSLNLDGKNAEATGERLAEHFELPSQSFALQDMIEKLYNCFTQNDAMLLEINPLIYTPDDRLIAGDCKMELDNAAAFRHPEWNFEDKPADTNFVTLNERGNVATIANGAGLAMATVDAVVDFGFIPANFLDIGGGANSKSILAAFQKIVEYSNVRAIIINIFAGITRCDEVAKAIVEAKAQIRGLPPLYIRLAGTNVDTAKMLLAKHQIPLLPTLELCLASAKEEIAHG